MNNGDRVSVTSLSVSTGGMLVAAKHINARREDVVGEVVGIVPGHGGDAWFVRHDDDAEVAAYYTTELEHLDGSNEVISETYEERPWGSFEVLLDSDECKVKRIIVKPQMRLSLQSHRMRHEHWIVVAGNGVFTSGYDLESLDTELVQAGEKLDIPPGMLHRIQGGQTGMTFIEVQTGAYFGEDDIERYDDDHGRV